MKARKLSSLLGLAFDGEIMRGVLLQRAGPRVRVRQAFQTTLSLNPVTSDPHLAGREIRNRLTEAGIHERRCVVCVPLQWALMFQTDVPELPESDVRGFLNVQAERRFPFALEDLSLSISRYQTPDGMRGATLAAIPLTHITALQKALQAAKLRPLGITLGVTALSEMGSFPDGTAVLLAGDNGVDFAITAGGGLVALRSIGAAQSAEPDTTPRDAAEISRELRITLGLLPQNIQKAVRVAQVFGTAEMAFPVMTALRESAALLAFEVKAGDLRSAIPGLESDLLDRTSPGLVAATLSRLLGRTSVFEFLPAMVSRLRQLTGRISARGTGWLAAAAVVLVLLVTGLMFYQQIRLSSLESQWKAIEPKVKQVAALQNKIRQFRPWYDSSTRNLQIARALTDAFPEDGAVWAKSLEIRETPETGEIIVSCSGKARGNREWLALLDRLRKTKGVDKLGFQQVRGETPLQFTLTFQWIGGESDGV